VQQKGNVNWMSNGALSVDHSIMLEQILSYFPAHTHPLTLVSDPDVVLADEQIMAALVARGFRIISDADPIALRYHVQRARPFTAEQPLIIVTPEPVNTLPYDLWQPGYHVTLELHRLFPNLAYPVLQALTPGQRRQLSEAQAREGTPPTALSARATRQYVLHTVFGIATDRRVAPAHLLTWLDDYHARNDPMPSILVEYVLAHLKRMPELAGWPLDAMLADASSFRAFVQDAWISYLHIKEGSVAYLVAPALPFDADPALQDIVGRLVRRGTLAPVETTAATLPQWAQPAIVTDTTDQRLHQFVDGLRELEQQLGTNGIRWEHWQLVAQRWAQLTCWRYDTTLAYADEHVQRFEYMQAMLDTRFDAWLRANYAPLANRALPTPHHVYHVPSWLAYQREQNANARHALLIMDGMALADWLLIRDVWQARHPAWHFDERLVLAQVPTITTISRQALVAGQRPAQLGGSLEHNQNEKQHWTMFWTNHGLPQQAIAYAHVPTAVGSAYPEAIDSRRTQALCLISPVIDGMLHGATQGTADVHASINVWLHQQQEHQSSHWFEPLIQTLLDQRYIITLTADHGHVEAVGMGQPREGVLVRSRSARARIYEHADIAHSIQVAYPHTILWHNDGLLPPNMWALLPQGRQAFAPAGQRVVSHGGLTIEEVVVPLVTIRQH